MRSIEAPTREERRGRGEEEEVEELDIDPGSGSGCRSVVSWGERHSRTQSQTRATADDGRTEARSGLSSSDRGAGHTVSDSGELPAQAHDRRSAAGCGRATGCSNTLESAGWRVDCRAQVGAQGAQGAERGGWGPEDGPRRGVIVGSSACPTCIDRSAHCHWPRKPATAMFHQFKHPSSMLTEPTWSTQAELIGHESRYLSARNCLQRRVTLSRTPPSKRRTTVWFRLCHFRNSQYC